LGMWGGYKKNKEKEHSFPSRYYTEILMYVCDTSPVTVNQQY